VPVSTVRPLAKNSVTGIVKRSYNLGWNRIF